MHHTRATYDENGDIVLAHDEAPVRVRAVASDATEEVHPAPVQPKEKKPSLLALEGARQLRASVADMQAAKAALRIEARSWWKSTWKTLQQPVWVPARKGKAKQYTRGTLFLIDTVRFGATFAVIFGGLFLTLNYQSFFSILQASLDPLASASAGELLQDGLNADGDEQSALTVKTTVGKATTNASLLAVLPPVGPPDNRIIIPRLNLNVPIVIPPQDSLIKEDWKQLETDIQESLESGVVHYPGTARPGQAGNFFVTGHSSYYPWAEGHYKSVFARLHDLQVGDEYWVYYGGDKHRYRIASKQEVSPSNVDVLDQPTDKRTATLMTCTPIGTALRRLIVKAEEIDLTTGEVLAVGEHEKRKDTGKLRMEQLPI